MLLVEDDPAVGKSLKRLLELDGLEVDWARDGEAGLALARHRGYDAIVLDRRLPKLTGDEVLGELKTGGHTAPVIFLTAFPDAASAFQAGARGACAYLEKGKISGAELCATVRKAAARTQPGEAQRRPFAPSGGGSSAACAEFLHDLKSGTTLVRDDVLRRLADVVSSSDVAWAEFAAASRAMRALAAASGPRDAVLLGRVRQWIADAGHMPADRRMEHVMSMLDASSQPLLSIDAAALASKLPGRASASGVGDLAAVRRCQRAAIMRRAVLALANSEEYVSQIAYGLGYSDAANFDHAFRGFFGISPTAFRRLL